MHSEYDAVEDRERDVEMQAIIDALRGDDAALDTDTIMQIMAAQAAEQPVSSQPDASQSPELTAQQQRAQRSIAPTQATNRPPPTQTQRDAPNERGASAQLLRRIQAARRPQQRPVPQVPVQQQTQNPSIAAAQAAAQLPGFVPR